MLRGGLGSLVRSVETAARSFDSPASPLPFGSPLALRLGRRRVPSGRSPRGSVGAARRSFLAQPQPLKWTAGALTPCGSGRSPQSGQGVGRRRGRRGRPRTGARRRRSRSRRSARERRSGSAAQQPHAALGAVERPLVRRGEPAVCADQSAPAGRRDRALDAASGPARTGSRGCSLSSPPRSRCRSGPCRRGRPCRPSPTTARQIMSPVASSQWAATPPTIALYSG